MKPLHERLNDLLEQQTFHHGQNGQHQNGFILPKTTFSHDPELDELVALARRVQTAPQSQVDPAFANQLKRRMLRRHVELQLQQRRKQPLFSLLRAHPAWSAVVGLCLLFCVLSTSVLALAAQVSNPNNPLYAITNWEKHFTASLGNAEDRATLDVQIAHDRLYTLAELADASHAGAYRQALNDLDQDFTTAASAINQLPAGDQRTQLADKLTSLQRDALPVLRGLLPRLALPERLATTNELARLGDTVPRLTGAMLILPEHPNGSATIRFSGSNVQPGAQLVVDNKPIEGSTWNIQNGQIVFVVNWRGNLHPHSLGILNPDGTVAEISPVNISPTDPNNNKGNDPNNNNKNGNGKPEGTPTPPPHH